MDASDFVPYSSVTDLSVRVVGSLRFPPLQNKTALKAEEPPEVLIGSTSARCMSKFGANGGGSFLEASDRSHASSPLPHC